MRLIPAITMFLAAMTASCDRLPARAACDLEAVSALSEDPEQTTIADLKDVIARRKACRAADAGQ